MAKVEEITDLMSLADRNRLGIGKGRVLKFVDKDKKTTSILVTRVTKTRMWGRKIDLYDQKSVQSHTGHDVETNEEVISKYGAPYCHDCHLPVSQYSTEDGDKKARDRKDDEDEHQLADGTRV